MNYLKPAFILLIFLTFITGIIYPLTVTGLAQLLFPEQSKGSLLKESDKLVGSALIGQNFTRPEYFHGRLSATDLSPYNGLASGGSNLALSNPLLKERMVNYVVQLQGDRSQLSKIPVDLLTASGSGLDPDISIEAANFQIQRVATARQLTQERIKQLIELHTSSSFVIFGEPVVNVLQLNLALDKERNDTSLYN